MFDHINFNDDIVAAIGKLIKEGNELYGPSQMQRLNYAAGVLSNQIERELSPNPMQRPSFYLPGLTAKPWYDVSEFEQVALLESSYETIKRELLYILSQNRGFNEQPAIDKYIVRGGTWESLWVKDGYKNLAENWEMCPETKRIVDSIPRIGESAAFSVLGPGARIHPHCGIVNFRLTMHLGLIIPDGCEFRVGGESHYWEEGKCFVFDDSFIHEAWNRSEELRAVFIVDLWHPDLTDGEVQVLENILHYTDTQT